MATHIGNMSSKSTTPVGITNEPKEDSHPLLPLPDWDEAKAALGAAWEVHVYGFGVAFGLLAIYSLISVVRMALNKKVTQRWYFIVLNAVMFLMAVCRALFLLIDAYNSDNLLHPVVPLLLWSASFPCITAAFSILLLVLLQSAKMRLLPTWVNAPFALGAIIVGHFVFTFLSAILVYKVGDAKIMLIVLQAITVIWGLLLFCSYMYIFQKFYTSAKFRHRIYARQMSARSSSVKGQEKPKHVKFTLTVAMKITMLVALLGLIYAIVRIYGMVIYAFHAFKLDRVQPWTWWFYNTSLRLMELTMCITMTYIATQPFRSSRQRRKRGRKHLSAFSSSSQYNHDPATPHKLTDKMAVYTQHRAAEGQIEEEAEAMLQIPEAVKSVPGEELPKTTETRNGPSEAIHDKVVPQLTNSGGRTFPVHPVREDGTREECVNVPSGGDVQFQVLKPIRDPKMGGTSDV